MTQLVGIAGASIVGAAAITAKGITNDHSVAINSETSKNGIEFGSSKNESAQYDKKTTVNININSDGKNAPEEKPGPQGPSGLLGAVKQVFDSLLNFLGTGMEGAK